MVKTLKRIYIDNYKWLLLAVLTIFTLSYLLSCKFSLIKDTTVYFQTIFIGLVTFGIPFLWNAYQRILEIKSKSIGDKIDNIKSKEFYQKANNYFEALLLYPTGFLVFFGLIISPFLPIIFNILLVILSVIFFILQPAIFNWIEVMSATDLKNYLENTDPKNPDLLKVFKELWQFNDVDLEKEFSISENYLVEIFTKKVDELIEDSTVEYIRLNQKYLTDFLQFINNRILFTLFVSSFFKKLLEWNVDVWRKEENLLGKGPETIETWSQYSQLNRFIDSIINEVTKRVLDDRTMVSYSFFDQFSEHINKYKDEKVEVKKDYDRFYIQHYLHQFFQIFFEKIDLSPDKYNIWEHYFPKNLKIHTATAVNDILQRVVLGEYLQWAEDRIGRTNNKKEYDSSLEDVSKELFPEVNPVLWAEILTFALSPYNPKEQLKYVIEEHPRIFGSSRIRSYGGFIEDNADFQRKAQEYFELTEKSERKQTIEMILSLSKIVPLFYQTFSEKNLTDYIEQGNLLTYPADSENKDREKTLISIFKELLESSKKK